MQILGSMGYIIINILHKYGTTPRLEACPCAKLVHFDTFPWLFCIDSGDKRCYCRTYNLYPSLTKSGCLITKLKVRKPMKFPFKIGTKLNSSVAAPGTRRQQILKFAKMLLLKFYGIIYHQKNILICLYHTYIFLLFI